MNEHHYFNFTLVLSILFAFSHPLSSSADSVPDWCKGEQTPSFAHSTDIRPDWAPIQWNSLPAGTLLNWNKMQTQIDLHRRSDGKLYRNQFTAEVAPGADTSTSQWVCADANATSPWFKEQGDLVLLFQRAMDGGFTIISENFEVKKHESVFEWQISMTSEIQPNESIASSDDLQVRLLRNWDHVTLFQNRTDSRHYQIIYERRRAVVTDTDVDHTVVLDVPATN